MSNAAFNKQGEYDLQSEIDRKVLDTLEKLDLRYNTGQITEAQLSEGFLTLYTATFGLCSDEQLQTVIEAYERTVEVPDGYFVKMRKLNAYRYVTWRVNTSYIEVTESDTGDVKRIDVPTRLSPHEFYNAALSKLESAGWVNVSSEDENDE